jgi:hypothetical protein
MAENPRTKTRPVANAERVDAVPPIENLELRSRQTIEEG